MATPEGRAHEREHPGHVVQYLPTLALDGVIAACCDCDWPNGDEQAD